MTTCNHNSYQCTAPIALPNESGQPIIFLPQWCTVCGDVSLRLPQIHDGDQAVLAAKAALVKAPPGWRPGIG